MKFKEYLKNLNKKAEDDPSCLEREVIFSIDEEGNGYERVEDSPTCGLYSPYNKGNFTPTEPNDHLIEAILIN